MKKQLLLLFLLGLTLIPLAHAQMPVILPLRQQAQVTDAWLQNRFTTVLPAIMRREGVDMWLIIAREYNEDPVLKTMLPATWLSARRTTMLIIYDNGTSLEALACARYDVGTFFKKAWDPEAQPDQWKRLAEIIQQRNPKKIAVNRSEYYGHADGISSFHYDKLQEVLPANLQSRVVSGERLAIGWLETRTPEEMVVYEQIGRIAHQIIAEGFSETVIQPGITTTEDVVWWYRQRIKALQLDTWFHPSVDVQRKDPDSRENERSFASRPDANVIMPGDLVHVDFGITYLGLCTDTQENAYVLRAGETEAPAYLRQAHQKALRLMDIFTGEFRTGRTGNEVLADALRKAKAEGLNPTIYTHPIGFHGHAAGPTIGLWDQQGGVPYNGDYPLYPNTAYSIELNNRSFLPEWNKEIRMMMEEDAFFDGQSVRYIDGRQRELFLIPRPQAHLGR
ncbi:MAG: aminopeptidase P family protein [Lewinellaceae bacterium]|nr:aminopeptidase P family protein [Lewinellaceae bacterium]